MKLRWYSQPKAWWHWDSREKTWSIRRAADTPRLQVWSDMTHSWNDVPFVVEESGPGPEPLT